MAKEEQFELEGQVTEILPNAMFRVKLSTGNEILAHISGKMRMNHINILLHDQVVVQLSMYDLTKGRIIFRKK